MYSKYVILFLFISNLVFLQISGDWSLMMRGADSWGYYGYLPATFIHHDLGTLETSIEVRKKYHAGDFIDNGNPLRIDEAKHLGEGRQVMKYSMGVAILLFPFFIIAHFLAMLLGFEADGYSSIYAYVVHHASLFYVTIGFLALRKVLQYYFEDGIVALTILALGIGTNLFFFVSVNPVMSHSFLFALYCVLIYASLFFYQKPSWKLAFLIGFCAGMIPLVRPVEIFSICIPFTIGIFSILTLKERFLFFKNHWNKIIFSGAIYAAIGFLQLLYWKWATGSFVYYSYEEEGFDFSDPHIIEGIFGFKNGWLVFTPVMIFSILGLFVMKKKDFVLPLLLYFPIHVFLVYTWWCWYHINGFGSRPMIESYPLLAFPFASFVAILWRNKWTKIMLCLLVGIFIHINLMHTYLVSEGVFSSSDASKAFYWSSLGKPSISYNDFVLLDVDEAQPKLDDLNFVKNIHFNDFNDSLNHVDYICKDTSNCIDRNYYFDIGKQYSPSFKSTYGELNLKEGDWLRLSVKAKVDKEVGRIYHSSSLVCSFEGEGEAKWKGLRLENKIGGKPYGLWKGKLGIWDELSFFVKIPKETSPNQLLKIYVWQPNYHFIHIDDLRVDVYEGKD